MEMEGGLSCKSKILFQIAILLKNRLCIDDAWSSVYVDGTRLMGPPLLLGQDHALLKFFCLPQKHLFEALFLRFWDFTVMCSY